jgi:hypothetical protein
MEKLNLNRSAAPEESPRVIDRELLNAKLLQHEKDKHRIQKHLTREKEMILEAEQMISRGATTMELLAAYKKIIAARKEAFTNKKAVDEE